MRSHDVVWRAPEDCSDATGTVVAIDVFRSFTFAAWALALGATALKPARTIEEALACARAHPDSMLVKGGAPDARFALSNSPAALLDAPLRSKTLIVVSSSGMPTLARLRRADLVLCAAFVNASATARFLRSGPRRCGSITIVPTGEAGKAIEDVACGQYIVDLLTDPSANATRYVSAARGGTGADELRRAVQLGHSGVDPHDMDRCLDTDLFDFAIVLDRAGSLLRRRSEA
jgi:2-phosphosulfolactate phosphatase